MIDVCANVKAQSCLFLGKYVYTLVLILIRINNINLILLLVIPFDEVAWEFLLYFNFLFFCFNCLTVSV